ncbi:MAG: hypothetical protein M3457_02720 [Chloroflexota bacterium]|nr:hypothetical protein [Chloroflexota bacterium]
MIQPGRFKIHESTRLWTVVLRPGYDPARRSFPILRRTARKVVIQTPAGERWIDRLPLERNGRTRSHGTVYYLSRFAITAADDREDVAA